jgi:23S rRNA (cytosine1962-C5)-methyltransferase
MPFNSQTQKLFKVAQDQRKALRANSNAIRLINGQGDGLPGLVLEQYNKHFVAQIFNTNWIQEAEVLREFILENFSVDYLIIKDRTQSPLSNPEDIKIKILIENSSSKTVVTENSLKFEVDLNDTLNTGLFLDMRANRLLVSQSCAGKKVLNCFSYTCSFGVYAKAKGATEVVNVDVSSKILERGRRNYQLNGFEVARNELIKADAVLYLEKAIKKDNYFDVIILDPPSFSRAGEKVFSVQKDVKQLIELALTVLNDQGKLFVSTNYSGITNPILEEIVRSSNKKPRNITKLGQDQDFPGSGQVKESHLAALWVEY